MATILGTAGDDVLSGAIRKPGDLIDGLAGNDTITGYHPDTVYGGDGDDVITFGGIRYTRIFIDGGAGNDVITAIDSNSRGVILGGDGNDTITVNNGQVYAGDGDDTVYQMMPTREHFSMRGGDGYDTLYTDWFDLRYFSQPYHGWEKIVQTGDYARGRSHHDDSWVGDDSDQRMEGLGGSDTIGGGGGSDTIDGGVGHDVLAGDDGDDWLYGQGGGDTLTGGDGADQFVVSPHMRGRDVVTDWQDGIDLIRIQAAGSFDDLIITAHGNGVRVNFSGIAPTGDPSGSGSIVLVGVAVSAIDAGDFLFA